MITLKEYEKNPCGLLSIPYWKAKSMQLPDSMEVVHHSDFNPQQWDGYEIQCFFRLFHDLKEIPGNGPNGYFLVTAKASDVESVVSVINSSYTDLKVTSEQIRGYRETEVFREDLWILARDERTDALMGCAMADFDRETGELSVEWVQVLPQYRGRGIGRNMVSELLRRGRAFASFATVSGRTDSETKPEAVYRKCGFTGKDKWYIMRKI